METKTSQITIVKKLNAIAIFNAGHIPSKSMENVEKKAARINKFVILFATLFVYMLNIDTKVMWNIRLPQKISFNHIFNKIFARW